MFLYRLIKGRSFTPSGRLPHRGSRPSSWKLSSCCAFLDVSLHLWLSLPSLRNIFFPSQPSITVSRGFRGPASLGQCGPRHLASSAGCRCVQLGRKPRSTCNSVATKKKESFQGSALGPLLSLSLLSLKHLLEALTVKTACVGDSLTALSECRSSLTRVCPSLFTVTSCVPRLPRACRLCGQEFSSRCPPLDLTPLQATLLSRGLGY